MSVLRSSRIESFGTEVAYAYTTLRKWSRDYRRLCISRSHQCVLAIRVMLHRRRATQSHRRKCGEVDFKYIRMFFKMEREMKSFDSDECLGHDVKYNFKNKISEGRQYRRSTASESSVTRNCYPRNYSDRASPLDPAMYKVTSIKDYSINSDTICTDIALGNSW